VNIGGSETDMLARTRLNSSLSLRCFLLFFFFFADDVTASVAVVAEVLIFLDDVAASCGSCFRFFEDVKVSVDVDVMAVGDIEKLTDYGLHRV